MLGVYGAGLRVTIVYLFELFILFFRSSSLTLWLFMVHWGAVDRMELMMRWGGLGGMGSIAWRG